MSTQEPRERRPTRGIGGRTVGGFGWMLVSGGGRTVLHVVTLAVLARLITPTEFGITSAALVVVAFTAVFTEAGVGPALVQLGTVTTRHVRTGLTVSVLAAGTLWLLLLAGAATVAAIFRMPALATVMPAMTSVLVIRSLTLGQFLLLRSLDFRKVALVELGAWLVGNATLSIALALRGYGVWAIVAGHVAEAVLATIAFARLRPHAYRPLLDRAALRELLTFGGGYTLGWWANFVARQGDNFVVGRWLGAEALGLYTRAYSLMRQPATLFGQVVNRVLFPAMAAVQDDRTRLRRMYLLGVTTIAVLVLPLTVIAHVVAPELVVILLGERWLPLTDAFDVMVFGMLFRTSYKLSDSLATATGHVYRRAWRQFVYGGLIVLGALAGRSLGIRGVAVGVLVALAVNFLLMADLSLRVVDGRWWTFAAAHVPGVLLAAAVAVPVIVAAELARWLDAPAGVVLLLTVTVGAATALAGVRTAPRLRAAAALSEPFREVLRVLGPGSRRSRALSTVLGRRYALAPDVPAAPEVPV